jgi:hypothetical protein
MTSRNTEGTIEDVTWENLIVRGKVGEWNLVPSAPLRVYGARFPTAIYTRGCHWIPRMFA